MDGDFICEKTILDFARIKLFRPVLYCHVVTQVDGNRSYILRFRWVYGAKDRSAFNIEIE